MVFNDSAFANVNYWKSRVTNVDFTPEFVDFFRVTWCCQLPCPGNRETIKKPERLDAITEEETKKILEGNVDENLLNTLSDKIKMFSQSYAEKVFPFF